MNTNTDNPLKSIVVELEKFNLFFNQSTPNQIKQNYEPKAVYKKNIISYLELKNQLIELMKELKANKISNRKVA